ncbi:MULTISPECIES: putative bifunctional diguanylate cyclase/phosphodiesterase [Kaistia]|uniref:EAL domain-containing protein n=1 Tax=Kaistia nematophila TaxID=2994654 RepID=A0A9X3E1I9_9HYPH|nr:EAL domain-containing protein [Kaistia nematophila]
MENEVNGGMAIHESRHQGSDRTAAILSTIGEVVYRWSQADDRIEWNGDAAALFGLASPESVATGAAFSELVEEPGQLARQEALAGTDTGDGVPYQIEYALRPKGARGPILWVEDTGRWYADGGREAVRAEGVLRVINERHAREQRLAFLSRHDDVTGLYNRSYLLDLLDETITSTRKLDTAAAFLVIAIDDFHLINDAYGYRIGDRVLAAVARRIRGRLRDGDAIGRFSGHKLGLILMNCDEHEMPFAAERFLAAIRDDVVATPDGAASVTISIGGVSLPRHAQTPDEAIERAQESLGFARDTGRGRFFAYAPSAEREAERQSNIALSQQLIGALSEQRVRLAFQPVVDIHTRKVGFHEALLRLAHPDGTIVSAGQVVPLAERLGLSRLFDLAVLDQVLETLIRHPDAHLSMNVSPETAAGPDWLAKFAHTLDQRPDLGQRLIVEITETSAIRSLDDTAYFVSTIHDLGARLAIDDFGAGFTSFRNLRELRVDIVKIDGSFIATLPRSRDDQIFVRRLVELAHDLGIETVAEWVQDEETAAMLAEWGVSRIQGHLCGAASLELPWK